MPTIRQEKLADKLIENFKSSSPKNKQDLVVSVGYSEMSGEKKATEIIESKGTQKALEIRGFTPEKAKEVVASIMTSERVKPRDRLTAADMTFKVHGSYAPEKRVVQQTTVEGTPQDYVEAKALAERYEQEYLRLLKGE